MTMLSLLSRLGGSPPSRRTTPPPTVYSDEIGEPPAGAASAPGAPGAQLHDLLAVIRRTVPAAIGLAIRNGRLAVAYSQPPDGAVRAAVRAALADHASLAQLAPNAATRATPPAGATPGDPRAQLLDASLGDGAWLRAFRRYQVALLSAQPAHGDTK